MYMFAFFISHCTYTQGMLEVDIRIVASSLHSQPVIPSSEVTQASADGVILSLAFALIYFWLLC